MDTIDTAEPDEFARLLAQLNGEPDPAAAPSLGASTPVAPAAPLQPAAVAPLLPPPSAVPPAAPLPAFPPQPTAMPANVPPAMPAAVPPGTMPPVPAPIAAEIPDAVTPPVLPPAVALLAPAFGLTTPVPARVAPIAVPTPASPPATVFSPVAAPVPIAPSAPSPVTPPVTRAPELMGADELAAPPSASSANPTPPVETVGPLPLVSPQPIVDVPLTQTPLAAALAATPPPLASASPVLAPAPIEADEPRASSIASTAQPTAAPPTTAPPTTVPPTTVPPTTVPPATAPAATAPPARPGAPVDFAALLSTSVGADDAPSAAAAPLVFGTGSPDGPDDEPDIGRSTLFEKIGLVLAVVVAPLGLIVGIVSAVLSVRRRGWVIGIVRATIVIGALLTVSLGVGGYYEYTQYQQQLHHDQIASDSAAFCATLKTDPSMYQSPTFGWPAVAASIPDSITAMQAFEDRWVKLAKVSPTGIKGEVTKVATAAKQIVDSVTVSRVVNDPSNVAVMSSVASSSGIQAWHAAYCG